MGVWWNCRILALAGLLAGCGGGATVLTPENLVGRSFVPSGPTLLAFGSVFDTISGATYDITFTGKDTATLTLFGQVILLTRNTSGDLVSSDGLFTLFQTNQLLNAKQTPDIVFLTLIDDFNTAGSAVTFSAVGNNTPATAMPTSGNATFSGSVAMFDGSPNFAQGAINLTANFGAGAIGGSITGGLPSAPNANFLLVPTSLFGGDFQTTLTSTDVAVFDSGIGGSFFGSGADQIGGTVYLLTSSGNAAGLFSASN